MRGFTLVEVMVALAVVAIALPALMFSLSRQVDDTAYLRDKSLARMVAQNKLAEKRLRVYAESKLAKEKEDGLIEFAGREWYWWMETEPTKQVSQFFKIEIDVALGEDHQDNPVFTLVSYIQGDLKQDLQGPGPGQNPSNPQTPNNPAQPQPASPTPVPQTPVRLNTAPEGPSGG
jgi:general secretion pathway protein I